MQHHIETLKRLVDVLSNGGITDTSSFNATDTTNYVRTLSLTASTWTPVVRFWVPLPLLAGATGLGVAVRVKNRQGATQTLTMRFLIDGSVVATSAGSSIANNAENSLGARELITHKGLREVVVELHSTGSGNVDILYVPWHMLEDSPA